MRDSAREGAGAGRDALTSLSLSVCPLLHFTLCPFSCGVSLQMEQQLPGGSVWLPALDLEKWYQEVMAGFETSFSSVSPPSSPPPLPAKAHLSHKPLQVIPASCCWGSGFGAAGRGRSRTAWGYSCQFHIPGAARQRQNRPTAGCTPGAGSCCLLLPAPLPRWHRHRGRIWGGDAQPQ